ncbi:hypothetical protein P3T76_010810 [Phytophthora citrophthora]|uniref:Uncharacterized protein n=1 Tax=Phytophthora citrophthora TaxID=4793 RepID=A0AAD9GAZ0_9STRA|nr:hypothetical protein P3T76_010810 [Phytophthora citrophthora]
MAPKISSMLGFHEREQLHKNPSILAYTGDVGRNYLDLGDGYNSNQEGDGRTAAPSQNNSTEKKKVTNSSRLTSLSSSLNSARTAMTSRARKLHVRESTLQAISQLRKTMSKAPSSRSQHSQSSTDSTPQSESNQFDNDPFNDVGNQAAIENAGYECMYAEVNLGNEVEFTHRGSITAKSRLSRMLPSRPWLKSFKQKQRFSEELY